MIDDRLAVPQSRLPLGVLGCLLAVVAIEWQLKRNDLALSNIAALNWKVAGREARRQTQPGNLLCFGTSLVKFGVVPRTLERETGLRAYNLGLVSGHMTSSYYMLARSLASGARPAAILVDNQDSPHDVDDLEDEERTLRTNIREWPELLSSRELLDLSWRSRDARLFGQVGLSMILPSYKARHDIRAAVLASLNGTPLDTRAKMQQVRDLWAYHRGVFTIRKTTPSTPSETPNLGESTPNVAVNPRLRRSELAVLYRERFLRLAASHGLRVYWIMPPLPPSRQAERDDRGIAAMMTEEARDVVARHPNVVVLDARTSGFPEFAYHDVVHLNAAGAELFSEKLATAIRDDRERGAPAGRWANLPRIDAAQWARLGREAAESAVAEAPGRTTIRR